MDKISYGTIIKNIRKMNNLTQKELGNKVYLNKATISAYELNKIMPPTDIFFKICEVCHVEIIFKANDKFYEIKDINREF